VEAGFMAVLFGAGVALSIALAFGVLRVTVHAMSTVDVPAASNAELTAAGLAPLASSPVPERRSRHPRAVAASA